MGVLTTVMSLTARETDDSYYDGEPIEALIKTRRTSLQFGNDRLKGESFSTERQQILHGRRQKFKSGVYLHTEKSFLNLIKST